MENKRIKTMLLSLLLSGCLLLLSGCSFSDLMTWGSGIKTDPDYETWEKLSENGKLDDSGKYTSDAIHVTIARNGFLEMTYFQDPEMKQEITEENCYLLPGDFIYCKAKTKPEFAAYYMFDHLEVIEYSDQNVRGSKLNWSYGGSGSAILIPYDYKGTEVSIEPIGHYKIVKVKLEQPKVGGRVYYYLGGEELTGETAEVCCGSKIKGQVVADSGWEMQISDKPTYTVTDADIQTVTFEGKKADDFFVETEEHKPTLRVDMHKSLGTCSTTVKTSDYKEENITRHGTVIFGKKIGTADGISLSFDHFVLENNKKTNTVRVTVIKKANDMEYKEIHYASSEKPTIYISLEREVKYSEVAISIEAVNAEKFKKITSEDADIAVKLIDVSYDNPNREAYLTEEDIITADRRVGVSVSPHAGFRMVGSNTNENGYYSEMRYDEYQRIVQNVLNKQMLKICKITLDTSDEHGKVEYMVDGITCNGMTDILEGKEIVIHYTLEDDSYEIAEGRDILNQIDIFDADRFKKYEKRIKVDRGMDGKTIKRQDYIAVRKKVN